MIRFPTPTTLFEQDGIRATIKVQSAAKKVAEENTYLRELLPALGLDQAAINEWVTRGRCSRDATEKAGRQCRKHAAREKTCNKAQRREPNSAPSSQPRCSPSCATNSQADSSLSGETIAKLADRVSDASAESQIHDPISPPQEDISSSA